MPPDAARRRARPGRARACPGCCPSSPGRRGGPVIRRRAALAGEDLSKAQLLEHVLGTLDRLSGVRPVLLAVEDLHWADRSTLDLIAFLFRSLRQSRVMIAVTYRSDELHRRHPLRPLLTSWERDRSINRIDLSRFSRDEVAAQLGAILGERPTPAVTDTVFDRSGGNAYLVEELAGAGARRTATRPTCRRRSPTCCCPGRLAVRRTRRSCCAPPPSPAARSRTGCSPRWRASARPNCTRAARDGRQPPARRRPGRARLRLPARADQGRRLRGHAARRARPAARGVRRGARPRPGAWRAARPTRPPLAYHWYAALDLPRALPASVRRRRGPRWRRGAPAEALRLLERALEIWPRVRGRRAAHGHGPGRRQPPRRQRRLPVRGARPGAVLLADALAELPDDGEPPEPPGAALLLSGTRSSSATKASRRKPRRRCGRPSACCRRTRSPGRTRWSSPRWPAPRCAPTT